MKLQWTPTFLCSYVLMFYFCMMESSKLAWWDGINTFINFNSYCRITFQVDPKAHSAALIGLSFKRPTNGWDIYFWSENLFHEWLNKVQLFWGDQTGSSSWIYTNYYSQQDILDIFPDIHQDVGGQRTTWELPWSLTWQF